MNPIARLLVAPAALLALASSALAQQTVSIDLAGLRIQNGLNQTRTSSPNTISPAFRYTYAVDGLVRGSGGILGVLYPTPTPLSTVLETLSPGSSAGLSGVINNCSGAHPVVAPPTTQSGTQVLSGITVTFSLTLGASIDASNIASFSFTNVSLSPSILVGSLVFSSGSVQLARQDVCYANCDGSTIAPVLNAGDFTCFLAQFRAAQSLPEADQLGAYANCDCSTTAPVLNAGDFSCFLSRFRSGQGCVN